MTFTFTIKRIVLAWIFGMASVVMGFFIPEHVVNGWWRAYIFIGGIFAGSAAVLIIDWMKGEIE